MKRSRNPLARKFAKFCRHYLDYYNDYSYDFFKNGEADLLKKLSPLNFKTIFDVGSNLGEWAKISRSFFRGSRIYCFEISEKTFNNLSNNLRDSAFILNNFGLADKVGYLSYKDYGENSGVNTIIVDVDFHDAHLQPRMVSANLSTGDIYCSDNSIFFIDFLKVDVEGAEHLVLEGFKELLKENKVRVIQFEYGYANGDAKFLMKDFYKFFEQFGYVVGRVQRGGVEFHHWNYELNNFKSGPNFIAVRSSDFEVMDILK
jgi:FkbM family methyltransferase